MSKNWHGVVAPEFAQGNQFADEDANSVTPRKGARTGRERTKGRTTRKGTSYPRSLVRQVNVCRVEQTHLPDFIEVRINQRGLCLKKNQVMFSLDTRISLYSQTMLQSTI